MVVEETRDPYASHDYTLSHSPARDPVICAQSVKRFHHCQARLIHKSEQDLDLYTLSQLGTLLTLPTTGIVPRHVTAREAVPYGIKESKEPYISYIAPD